MTGRGAPARSRRDGRRGRGRPLLPLLPQAPARRPVLEPAARGPQGLVHAVSPRPRDKQGRTAAAPLASLSRARTMALVKATPGGVPALVHSALGSPDHTTSRPALPPDSLRDASGSLGPSPPPSRLSDEQPGGYVRDPRLPARPPRGEEAHLAGDGHRLEPAGSETAAARASARPPPRSRSTDGHDVAPPRRRGAQRLRGAIPRESFRPGREHPNRAIPAEGGEVR